MPKRLEIFSGQRRLAINLLKRIIINCTKFIFYAFSNIILQLIKFFLSNEKIKTKLIVKTKT